MLWGVRLMVRGGRGDEERAPRHRLEVPNPASARTSPFLPRRNGPMNPAGRMRMVLRHQPSRRGFRSAVHAAWGAWRCADVEDVIEAGAIGKSGIRRFDSREQGALSFLFLHGCGAVSWNAVHSWPLG